MEKIGLKSILDKHANINLDEDGYLVYYEWEIIEAMKEVWNLAIDKCKESAEVNIHGGDYSIEQVKQMIL